MNGTWGSDFAKITVEPDDLRDYATRCTEAAGMFGPDSFLIQNATFVRLLAIRDTIEELALGVRQTAEAVEIQDASASSSINDTLDTDLNVESKILEATAQVYGTGFTPNRLRRGETDVETIAAASRERLRG